MRPGKEGWASKSVCALVPPPSSLLLRFLPPHDRHAIERVYRVYGVDDAGRGGKGVGDLGEKLGEGTWAAQCGNKLGPRQCNGRVQPTGHLFT